MTPSLDLPPQGRPVPPVEHAPEWNAMAVLRWLAGVAPLEPAPAAAGDWRRLLDRCGTLRVLPQAFLRLDATTGAIPPEDVPEFARRRLENVVRTSRAIHGGCRALRLLASAGIRAAGFKGIAAVGRLHGGQPRRGVGDTDVVVRPAFAEGAIQTLLAAGFRPTVAGVTRAEIIEFSRASPGSAGNESISLEGGDGAEIDLHWKLGAFDVDAMVADATPVRVLADDVLLVRPGMGLLLAVHHSLRNDFAPDECLRDLLDAAGWFELIESDPLERAWVGETARRTGLDDALGAFTLILARAGIDPRRPSPAVDTPSALLADLFREQCEEGAFNTDLVYLCSFRPGWSLVRGLLAGGRRHLRAMHAMEEANGETQRGIGERLRLLLGAARAVPLRRWRRLRTLARCKDRACRTG